MIQGQALLGVGFRVQGVGLGNLSGEKGGA